MSQEGTGLRILKKIHLATYKSLTFEVRKKKFNNSLNFMKIENSLEIEPNGR